MIDHNVSFLDGLGLLLDNVKRVGASHALLVPAVAFMRALLDIVDLPGTRVAVARIEWHNNIVGGPSLIQLLEELAELWKSLLDRLSSTS